MIEPRQHAADDEALASNASPRKNDSLGVSGQSLPESPGFPRIQNRCFSTPSVRFVWSLDLVSAAITLVVTAFRCMLKLAPARTPKTRPRPRVHASQSGANSCTDGPYHRIALLLASVALQITLASSAVERLDITVESIVCDSPQLLVVEVLGVIPGSPALKPTNTDHDQFANARLSMDAVQVRVLEVLSRRSSKQSAPPEAVTKRIWSLRRRPANEFAVTPGHTYVLSLAAGTGSEPVLLEPDDALDFGTGGHGSVLLTEAANLGRREFDLPRFVAEARAMLSSSGACGHARTPE